MVQFGSLWFIVVQTSVEPNKFLVRFFVSYCLHIYRLVSVIHRINAAFGVSSKFVPYRPNYDLVCQSLPYVITKLIATSTDYTLISALPIVLNKVGIYRISVFQDYSYTNPRGIIISRSNSDYTESLYVLAKSETSSDVASLSTSCLFYQSTTNVTNLYFWAKAKSVTTNQMGVIIEYLG